MTEQQIRLDERKKVVEAILREIEQNYDLDYEEIEMNPRRIYEDIESYLPTEAVNENFRTSKI